MAIYRPRRRVAWWVWVLAGVAALAAIVASGLWLQQRMRPDPRVATASALQAMVDQLDVLRLSHYTPEGVRDGQVLAPGEYQASFQDVERARQEWQQVRQNVPPDRVAEVESGLAQLEEQIRARRSAEDVGRQAENLIRLLQALTPAT